MAKKGKKKREELSVSDAQKTIAYLYHKKQKEDDQLREAAYVLLKETNPEFDYEVEPSEVSPDLKGVEQASSIGSTVVTTAAATTAATTATTAGISTVGAAIAQLQSLGTAGVIAMSSAVYFQGSSVYDNVDVMIDEVTPMIEELVITGTITPPPESSFYGQEIPKTTSFIGVKVGEARDEPTEDSDQPLTEEGNTDDTTSESETSTEDTEQSEDTDKTEKSDENKAVTEEDEQSDEEESEEESEDSSDEEKEEPKKKKSFFGLFSDDDEEEEEEESDEEEETSEVEEEEAQGEEEPTEDEPTEEEVIEEEPTEEEVKEEPKRSFFSFFKVDEEDNEEEQTEEPDEPEEIEVEEIEEEEPVSEPEEPSEPTEQPKGLFSLFANAINSDEPEQSDEFEMDEPETLDELPKIELSEEVVEASDSITDEQLEEVGISRDDFEIALQDMADNPDDYMMDIEEVDSDLFEVEEVVMIDETIFNEQIEDEMETEMQEDETINWNEIFGPGFGNDFGDRDATPI